MLVVQKGASLFLTQSQSSGIPVFRGGRKSDQVGGRKLCEFAGCRAEFHRLGNRHDRNEFSHSSEGWKSRCQEGCLLPRPLSLICRRPSSPCVSRVFASCFWLCPGLLPSLGTSQMGPAPGHMTLLCLYSLSNGALFPNSHILRFWGSRVQQRNFEETQFSS